MENPFSLIYQRLEELNSKINIIIQVQKTNINSSGEEFMNIEQLSDYLDESIQSIYSKTSKRTIPYYKKGKKLLFKKSDIDNWLEGMRKKTIAEIKAEI